MSPLHSRSKVWTYPQLAQVRGLRGVPRTKVAPKSGRSSARSANRLHRKRIAHPHHMLTFAIALVATSPGLYPFPFTQFVSTPVRPWRSDLMTSSMNSERPSPMRGRRPARAHGSARRDPATPRRAQDRPPGRSVRPAGSACGTGSRKESRALTAARRQAPDAA